VHVFDYFLLALLGLWLLMTVLNQCLLLAGFAGIRAFPNLERDPMAIIPRWLFWAAPHPREWQVLYRDKLPDGNLTPWKTAWSMRAKPLWWIWNPENRRWKAVADYCLTLLSLVAKRELHSNELFVSFGYVALAVYVSGIQPAPGNFRQFMIANVCRFDEEEPAHILFLSPLFQTGTQS
jgi:hypothetical protein